MAVYKNVALTHTSAVNLFILGQQIRHIDRAGHMVNFIYAHLTLSNAVSDAAFAPLQEMLVGTPWAEKEKKRGREREKERASEENTGISSLWSQLEKGLQEQWNNCACIGTVHKELQYFPAIENEEKSLAESEFLFFFPLKVKAGTKNILPLIYRHKAWLFIWNTGVERGKH